MMTFGVRSSKRSAATSTSWGSLLVSATTTLLMAFMLWTVLKWALFSSSFGISPDSCRDVEGACWAVIRDRWRIILFGLYPYDQHWRSGVALVVALITLIMACMPNNWTGTRMSAIWLCGYSVFLLLIHGGVPGLPVVTSAHWGGLTLTVFMYMTVIAFGLPLAIVLALVRRSQYPVFRLLVAFAVDATRSLPLLTILFAATLIIPLVLPEFLQGEKLARALVGFTFFFACYQSEIIRGGLQATPKGQLEAALALAMSYRKSMIKVVLPQAFRIVMPATINQFVITFKETSLVVIVGLFDLMASANAAYQTGKWSPFYTEVYVFVAIIYFTFAFSLSKYGKYVERRFGIKRR